MENSVSFDFQNHFTSIFLQHKEIIKITFLYSSCIFSFWIIFVTSDSTLSKNLGSGSAGGGDAGLVAF